MFLNRRLLSMAGHPASRMRRAGSHEYRYQKTTMRAERAMKYRLHVKSWTGHRPLAHVAVTSHLPCGWHWHYSPSDSASPQECRACVLHS